MTVNINDLESFFRNIQKTIITAFQAEETNGEFIADNWTSHLGQGTSCVLRDGEVYESAGVNFSMVSGDKLPAAASAKRPQFTGMSYQAMGVSVVVHPRNPHAPTSHANVRMFMVTDDDGQQHWWLGGGFDLTPIHLYADDACHFHTAARDAVAPFGDDLYSQFKQDADEYFYMPHREEYRGIGGIIYDDLNEWDIEKSLSFIESVAKGYTQAYAPIIAKRKNQPYTEQERQFQLFRRTRYVEFNLIVDRGTIFGLQSKGRTKSILMSMPPLASWHYDDLEPQNDAQQALVDVVSQPQAWI